jgi:SAM-dependent methyltransferase
MVHLEFTPVSAILEMIDQVSFGADDVFYDIGSGLGQVALLVAWLTDSQSRGVEIDPGYCCQAQRLAAKFGVTNVQFVQADACTADYSDGTIFFMFTPFIGQMLQGVLARLQDEAAKRPITLCTYGTVTSDVAELPWLRCRDRARLHALRCVCLRTAVKLRLCMEQSPLCVKLTVYGTTFSPDLLLPFPTAT